MTTAYFTSAAPHTEHFLITKTPPGDGAQPISLEYLNEGNANIIYRIKSLEQDTHLADPLRGKLLRLRKEKSFIRPTEEQYAAYTRHFVPLFQADDLIEQNLVRIDESITSSLNDSLSRLEKRGKRSASRLGDVLATREEYGLLMTDMTAQSGEVQFELKPKWLVQSPDAPSGAVRCRTCALRARRNAARSTYDSASDATLFCPLGLVSSDLAERRRVFEAIAHKQRWLPQSSGPDAVSCLAKSVFPVLKDLQGQQAKLDTEGILTKAPEHIPLDYLKAMTLRDCILLIKGEFLHADHFETRLADLDLKQAHPDKVSRWKETDAALVEEGWYTNTGAGAVNETVCLLSRKRR